MSRLLLIVIYNTCIMREFRGRLGGFFLMVGIALLALFFTSDFVQATNIYFLLWGIGLIVFGYLLRRGARPEQRESQRFRLLRRIFSRNKADAQKKEP